MHTSFRKLIVCALLSTSVNVQQSLACSPVLPLPTVRENYANATHVYLARLVSVQRSPLSVAGSAHSTAAIEDATFDVLLTLKGQVPEDDKVRTHTVYSAGNCTLSILHPADIIDSEGNEVANRYSDIWILVLEGTEPYSIRSPGHSRPINLFEEEDLRFLLEESKESAQHTQHRPPTG
jgi:hypothetical protein